MGLIIIFIILGIIIGINLINKDANKNRIKLLEHPTMNSIIFFIPIFIIYYFAIAMISGLILSIFRNDLLWYGMSISIMLSPILTVLTIIKIKKKKQIKTNDNINQEISSDKYSRWLFVPIFIAYLIMFMALPISIKVGYEWILYISYFILSIILTIITINIINKKK